VNGPRVVLVVALLVSALILQVTVLTRLPLPGATPDLVLVVVVGLALRWGPLFGLSTGFAAGLMLDLVPPADGTVGQWALVLTIVGYLSGLARDEAERSAFVAPLAVAFAAVAATLGYAGIGFILGDVRVTGGALARTLPAEVLYDLLLAPFAVWAVFQLARRVEPESAWR
jgi:rod shape-determining protein MreD